LDIVDQPISNALKESVAFIDASLASNDNNRVAVHCQAGRSRSVAVCLAYLMQIKRMSLKEALLQVQSKRPIAQPNGLHVFFQAPIRFLITYIIKQMGF
jgi:dual specificity phosphatase 12